MTKKDLLNANIIKLLGIEALPEDRKAAILDQVSDLIQRRIMLRVMDTLSEEEKDKMLEIEKDSEAIAAFMADKVKNLEKIMEEEVLKVKQELLDVVPKE